MQTVNRCRLNETKIIVHLYICTYLKMKRNETASAYSYYYFIQMGEEKKSHNIRKIEMNKLSKN